MKVFSGSSNKPLAEKVAGQLNTSLSPLEIFIFPDGERRVRVIDRVVEQDTVVIQSTSPNSDTAYMELFFIVDALKRSGAKSVTAVIPYLGYQRQDHVFRTGEAVSLEVIIETLESVGMNKLITFDLHSIKIPELFKIPIVHLSALPIFAQKIKEIFPDFKNSILVSPDMGGIRRIKILSEMLSDMPYISIVKDRDLETGNIKSNKIDTNLPDFKKEVKRAIIADDMISTGRTIDAAVDLLIEQGIEESVVFATHPVFSNDYKNILQNSKVSKVFVTDTINVPDEKMFEKLEILSVAGEIAKEIKSSY
ncbi:MAG: ribose-phosphate pyrophosphokinase [Patescibacteria group bacterium]